MKFILAQKKEMSQIFNEEKGIMKPVSIVQAGPCFVSQIKTVEKDGYSAVQVVFGSKKKLAKAQTGHFKNISANAHSREFRMPPEEASKFNIGDELTAGSFENGDIVSVQGTSKGHGFQGVVKRHGFKGSPASHGHKDQLRMPGSIGATDAARVFKGMRMGGHMGDERITTSGLTIEKVDSDANLLFIKGSVPGAINGIVAIKGNGEMNIEKPTKSKEPKEDSKGADQKTEEDKVSREEKQGKLDKPEKKETKEKVSA